MSYHAVDLNRFVWENDVWLVFFVWSVSYRLLDFIIVFRVDLFEICLENFVFGNDFWSVFLTI